MRFEPQVRARSPRGVACLIAFALASTAGSCRITGGDAAGLRSGVGELVKAFAVPGGVFGWKPGLRKTPPAEPLFGK